MTLEQELTRLKDLEVKATKGPWTADFTIGLVETGYQPECCESEDCSTIANLNYADKCCSSWMEDNNAMLIAAMRNALPKLIKAVEIQHKALQALACTCPEPLDQPCYIAECELSKITLKEVQALWTE